MPSIENYHIFLGQRIRPNKIHSRTGKQTKQIQSKLFEEKHKILDLLDQSINK